MSVALATCFFDVLASADTAINPVRLAGVHRSVVDLEASNDAVLTVVCFLGTECPLAKLYVGRLNSLSTRFSSHVRFIGINSNRQDSMQELREFAEQYQVGFELCKDFRNVVADQFQAQRTPEVFVLDRDFRIRYRGRIDDQYEPGRQRSTATRNFLQEAIEALLQEKEPVVAETTPVGCLIGRVREPVESSAVTYCDQIARVLQKNCVECHRAGQIGPFAMTEYEEVVGWADMMIEVIDQGRMPPWHANPEHGHFSNARTMSFEEKQLLRRWVEGGMPFGDPTALPPAPEFVEGWELPREPDVVIPMSRRPFAVPAEGTVDYQYFVVDPQFEEDTWVSAAQVVPGNRRVVHHSIVFIRPPDGSEFKGVGLVGTYVPGQGTLVCPPGAAIHVPAKSKLVFQQHYTPTGTVQADMTKIGLTLMDESKVTEEIYSLAGIDQEFEIPPHAPDHHVQVKVRGWPADARMLSITPHMHLRGKAFQLRALEAGASRILLDVPAYDFNWQHRYQLTTPMELDEVDCLEFEAVFDNSVQNPSNPDASEHVTWGDQTWEEMAVMFFEVAIPRSLHSATRSETATTVDADQPQVSSALQSKVRAEADRLLGAFDKNNDGHITRAETSFVFRQYSFGEIDADRDGKLTREEIERAARWRVR